MQPKKHVRDLMSHPVRTFEHNDELSIAETVMRNERIRHWPMWATPAGSSASAASGISSCGERVAVRRQYHQHLLG